MENTIPPTVTSQVSTTPIIDVPKQNNFLTILLSILLFISVVIAGFFAFQTQKLVKELTMLKTEPTPEITVEPTQMPIVTMDPTADWKTYTDSVNKFTFMYPSSLQIINDLKNIPMNSIHVNVVSVDLNTAIKQNEFDISILKDVFIPGRPTETFKKGTFERSVNGLVAFFPLNQSQTLIITEYFDASVTDITINNEFENILFTFKFTN